MKPVEQENKQDMFTAEALGREVDKYAARFSKLDRVDPKTFASGYFFPIVRKVLLLAEQHEAYLGALDDAVERLASGIDALEEAEGALTEAGEIITRFAGFLDEVVVHAGFYTVVKGVGLKASPTCPPSVRSGYEALTQDAREAMEQIVSALDSVAQARSEDEDEDDGADEPEAVNEPSPESAAESAAAAVIAEAASEANAQEDHDAP